MFSRKFATGLCLLAFAALIFWGGGCSDDKSTSSPGNAGSLTDPEFVQIQDQVNYYLDSAQSYFAEGFENVYKVPTDSENVFNNYGPMGPSDTATFGYYDGWYIVYVSRDNAYTASILMDSIQYQKDGEVIEDPAELDYLHFIRKWNFVFKNPSVSHIDMSTYLNLEYSGLDSYSAAVNGSKNVFIEWVYVSEDSTVEAQYDMDVTVSDIQLSRVQNYPWSSGCPVSGALGLNVNQSYRVTDDNGTDMRVRKWNVTIQFDSGVADITVASNGYTWKYTLTVCVPPTN